MSESLKDILMRRDGAEPEEIALIKDFVQQRFKSTVGVALRKDQIVISAKSAALAGTLRLHVFELQNLLKTKKRLIIRVGQ